MKVPFKPMLATLVDEVPPGKQWTFEEKYDGIRALAAKRGGSVRIWSRSLQDLTKDFDRVARGVDALRGDGLVLDGEVVVFDTRGVSSFQLLQRRGSGGRLVYAVFDLLETGGRSVMRAPLRDRRALLEELIPAGRHPVMRSRQVGRDEKRALAEARRRGWEGVIAKDETSPYEAGRRSRAWLKVKVRREAEFVVGGFTPPEGSRIKLGSLILGLFDGEHLRYVGRVGTGFTDATLRDLSEKMRPHITSRSPFDPTPKVKQPTWVRPKLVAQIAFAEWTADGRLRQPSFLGLRVDKPAKEVTWSSREP